MSEPALLVERDGHIVTLTFNRPRFKNCMNPEVFIRLADAWEVINDDDDIRAVILTGAGGTFCAGADLSHTVRWRAGEPPQDEFEERFRADPDIMWKGLLRDYRCNKAVIAAVEGSCIAGGVEILESTDIRIAGEGARFGISEVRWSVFPLAGSTVRLRRQIPYTKAMEMLLTGDHYPAEEALQMGLIGRLVPTGTALAKAREVAERVAANGPLAVRGIKRAVQETDGLTEAEAMPIEYKIGMEVAHSEDAAEGPRAFVEKRVPRYKGR